MKISHTSTGEGLEQLYKFSVQFFDKELLGHDAWFVIVRKVAVLTSNPVDSEEVIYEESFHINSDNASFSLQLKDLNGYGYDFSGKTIRVTLFAKCIVDDGLIFDTQHSNDLQIKYVPNDSAIQDAKSLIHPKDYVNTILNYRILATANKLYIILVVLLSIPLVFYNIIASLLGLFTSINIFPFAIDGPDVWQAIFIILGIVFAVFIWTFIKYQLKSYMTFSFKNPPSVIKHNSRIAMQELIQGKSKIALDKVTLRVVACNMENGQYTSRGDNGGTHRRTIPFNKSFRGIVLYEKLLNNIPPGMQISLFINGTCDFSKVYSHLYPPQMINRSHGIDIYWEVQLIHPTLVDQELIGKSNLFELKDFYDTSNHPD